MEEQDCSADSVGKIIKSLDNFLYAVANNVICAICQELFMKAVTNQCGHSFCSNCIKRFYAVSRYGKVNCPLCRHPIKRRSWIDNCILSKIAEICSEATAAFKEDVMKLNGNVEYDLLELWRSSRLSQICEEKVNNNETKEEKSKNCRKTDQIKMGLMKSNSSLVLCPVVSDNSDNLDMKSISQIGSTSESIVANSSDVEKKMRNVMGILSRKKGKNLSQEGNGSIATNPNQNRSKNDGGETLFMEPNEAKVAGSGTSMIRIDYLKSEKLNGICSHKTIILGKDDDPYEFVASQGNTPSKRIRASRRRKRIRPQFQHSRSFGREKLMKDNCDNSAVVIFDNNSSSIASVQKPVRTYGSASSWSKTMRENNEDNRRENILTRRRTKKVLSDSEDSRLAFHVVKDDSDIAVCKDKLLAKRRVFPPHPDSGDNYDSDCLKKPKTDDSKNEEVRKFCNSGKCTQSPGWSRVSNLKMDFESAGKRSRTCRKTLNISGGELNVNTSKMKSTAEISPKNDKKIETRSHNNLHIEDLSQNSNMIIGFDDSQYKKKDFKVDMGKMEKQPENVCNKVHDGTGTESKIINLEAAEANDETLRKTGIRNAIPFALLGKIKKKKRMSIVFIKMGRLSPYLMNSDKTIVKLLFSSVNKEKKSVEVQTNEATIKSNTVSVKGDKLTDEMKVNIGVQTQDILSSEEIDTSHRKNHPSVAIQTDTCLRSEIFEEFNTPKEEVRNEKRDADIDLNTELQCELNETWMATSAEMVDGIQQNGNGGTATVNNGKHELMNPVINNINLDSSGLRDVMSPAAPIKSAKLTERYEESDSDIFIDQTPTKNVSANGGGLTEEVENREDSFLTISEYQSNIFDSDKLKFKSVEIVENDKNKPNEKSHESVKNRRLCIVSSGICNRKIIEKFVNRFKVEHSSFPKKEMTHLVVGLHENEEDELVPYCTPKFLYAVANKKWIVTESWVEECLKSEAIVREEPFESVDPVGGNGCNIARLSTNFLLDNWEIYLYGEFVTIAKEEFAELLQDCGGTIVPHLKDFSYTRNKIRMILLDGSGLQEKKKEYEALSKTYRTLVMSRDVAIMSIQSYKMVNFTPFVQHLFSTEECVEWGYPFRLVKKKGNLDDSHSDGISQ